MTGINQRHENKIGHSLFTNILSGGIVRIFRAILQIVTTPIVIALLGQEQYGLVIFTLTLQMVLFMFDQAISPAVIRSFGRMGGKKEHANEMRDLLRSFEILSLGTALILGGAIILAAPFIATTWLQVNNISNDQTINAVRLMGLYVLFQWPSLFYNACFIGLRYQSVLASINIIFSIIQITLIIVVMSYWLADIQVYLTIQTIISLIMTLVMRYYLTRLIPLANRPPRFERKLLYSMKHLAGGMLCIGITTSILTQYDKVIASKVFPLDIFGIYGLTFNISAQLSAILTTSIMISVQPVLTEIVVKKIDKKTAHFYHTFSQINALIIFTSLGCLAVYPDPILELWLGQNSPMIDKMSELLPLVLIGTILNSISAAPYLLQMAAGWVKLKLVINFLQMVCFIIIVPIILPKFGIKSGAVLWIIINVMYIFIESPLVHRRILKGEYYHWLFRDNFLPAVISSVLFLTSFFFIPQFSDPVFEVIKLIFLSLFVGLVLILVLPLARGVIFNKTKIIFLFLLRSRILR